MRNTIISRLILSLLVFSLSAGLFPAPVMAYSFTIVRNQPGAYTVYAGSSPAGSFVVEEYLDPDIILYVSLGMIFTSFILSIIYIRRRRQEEYW